MLKQAIHSLEKLISSTSSSTTKSDVHTKWNHLCVNWVRSMMSNTQTYKTTSYTVPRERVDCIVIGAGVVGIAIARALALKGREVLVIESAPTFGTGTSSRNSEVIHAGIYYPRNSFKVCVFLSF